MYVFVVELYILLTWNKLMMIRMIMTGIIDLIITTIKVIGNHNFQVHISQKQIRKLGLLLQLQRGKILNLDTFKELKEININYYIGTTIVV